MGAAPVDFIIQGIREGITDNTQLAERAGISTDQMEVIYRRDKPIFDGLRKIIAKEKKKRLSQMSEGNNQTSKKNDLQLAEDNPFPPNYTDSTKTKLRSDQRPEFDFWNMFELGETSLDKICTCFLQLNPDKTKVANVSRDMFFMLQKGKVSLDTCLDSLLQLNPNKTKAINALNIISMPWLPENNWKSSILQRKDPAGNIFLHLQRSISFELKEAIQVVLKEIHRKEGKISLEQTPPAPQYRPSYDISDNCPYKDENETYAYIWQILKDHREGGGISKDILKSEAMAATGKSAAEIDEAIDVVTSRKDAQGEGCDERALTGRGYWVEENSGQLVIKFPMSIDDPPDGEGQSNYYRNNLT